MTFSLLRPPRYNKGTANNERETLVRHNTRRFRSLLLAVAIGIGAAGAAAIQAEPASASIVPNSGNNWIVIGTVDDMNAWGGGPWVKGFTGGATANGDFTWDHGSSIPTYMVFTNYSSFWANTCIGDANDNPNDSRASLNGCPGALGGNTQGDAWGTHLTVYQCDGGNGLEIYDNHWSGWVGPADFSDGAQFYLNKGYPFCFVANPAY